MQNLDPFWAIVGPDRVLTPGHSEFEATYGDPYWFDPDFACVPTAAVLAASVTEVQAVVRAANGLGVSLWVVSRGRNLGYGGAMPRDRESVVLDLRLMDRIREVDVESAYVVVEPGVSFFALSNHLRDNGIPLWLSVPDLGDGSVIANALERGFGYSAHGEHSAYLCGLEVVLPTGELIRTGMAAMADTSTAHLYKGGFGPSVDGLFFQSNLGIVVGAGIWLLPKPEVAAACLIHVPHHADLAALVDLVRPHMLNGVIDSVVIVGNALAIASQIMPRAALFDGPGPIPDSAIRAFADKLHVGLWNAKFGLYGPAPIVEAKLAVLTEAVSRVSGAVLDVRNYPGDVDPAEVHPADRAQLGIPSSDYIQMAAWRGGEPAHIDFSLVAPSIGSDAQRLVDLVGSEIRAAGFDHAGGFTMFGRHSIMLSLLSFDRSNAHDRAAVSELFPKLIDLSAEAGFAPYRAHPAFMDATADVYDFNDSALRRFIGTVKAAVDPSGVLSPGKQGIWPRQDSKSYDGKEVQRESSRLNML